MTSAAPTSQPTILFVHGAWHSPTLHYGTFIKGLEAAGYHVVAPALPSINGANPPTTTLGDDVATVKDAAAKLVDQGRPVLVVCHSYGGLVTTNAIGPELSFASRQKAGLPGGVLQLVYMCAFLPQAGGMVASIVADSGAPLAFDVDGQGAAIPTNPVEAFYGDVDPAEAKRLSEALIKIPVQVFATPTTAEAWRSYPITYLFCEHDNAITIVRQREMVAAAEANGAIKPVRTETYKSSHSPFVSMPKEMAGAIDRAWNVSAAQFKLVTV